MDQPNEYLCSKIHPVDAVCDGVSVAPRTELDSHANMCVLGKNFHLLKELFSLLIFYFLLPKNSVRL